MTNVGRYRGQPRRRLGVNHSEKHRPDNSEPREISPPPGLLLTAMLAQRVRIEFEDGMHWMSGYEALAGVLSERSRAGDARAAVLLSNLNEYAAVRGTSEEPSLPVAIAPETAAEKALTTAFVRRTVDGLHLEPTPNSGSRRSSASVARRKERSRGRR